MKIPPRVLKLKGVVAARNGKAKNLVVAKMIKASCEQFAKSVRTMTGVIGNQNQSRPNNVMDLKEFRKVVGERAFHGTEESIEAEKWLKGIKKEFDAHLVAEEDRVRFATYMFQGNADDWWESEKRMGDATSMSWAQFERLFLDKYFPPTVRSLKTMTVTQLDKKFNKLQRYGKHLVKTQELKARKLEDALKPGIRAQVVPLQHPTYKKVLGDALAIEANWIKEQKEREESEPNKKKNNNDSSPQRKRPHFDPYRSGHTTNKNKGKGCFRCGDDHLVKDCPIPPPPMPQNVYQPQQSTAHKTNSYARQPYQPRTHAPPFQPRQPNVQGKLNHVAEVKGEAKNAKASFLKFASSKIRDDQTTAFSLQGAFSLESQSLTIPRRTLTLFFNRLILSAWILTRFRISLLSSAASLSSMESDSFEE
ncbi:hypothetical protein MKW98_017951 [Papaver atlanticum]|uniref:Retrotransposon gag domain-containing protein n=1 Tax=Papaver atlanticum TaxID=357466 RepID=A0AAD4XWP2_9MAGN|nr:hypothetical protein MKW98_017951 [Papaver atlanticum]